MIAAFLGCPRPRRAKTAAEEGRDIVLSMLVVGLVFVGVILLGDVWNWRARKRHARARALDRSHRSRAQ